MNRKLMRDQVRAVVEPALAEDESVKGVSATWATEVPRRSLLLRARALHYLVITDHRVLVFSRPRRRRSLTIANLVISKRHDAFKLVRVSSRRPMLQVQVRSPGNRLLAFEFRPRDRGVGRDLANVVGNASRMARAATR